MSESGCVSVEDAAAGESLPVDNAMENYRRSPATSDDLRAAAPAELARTRQLRQRRATLLSVWAAPADVGLTMLVAGFPG
jgi:hypothetical protein